jgi:hypothetical protein
MNSEAEATEMSSSNGCSFLAFRLLETNGNCGNVVIDSRPALAVCSRVAVESAMGLSRSENLSSWLTPELPN